MDWRKAFAANLSMGLGHCVLGGSQVLCLL